MSFFRLYLITKTLTILWHSSTFHALFNLKNNYFHSKNKISNILLKYPILIIIFCIPLCIYAQEETPFHSTFTVEDGLPSNRIYDIIQDSKGYIWIGTSNGLVRFNGQEFKEYSTIESVNPEYSYLHELKDGSIWCINFGNQVLHVSGDSLKVAEVFKPYFDDKKYFSLHVWKDSILYLENQNRIVSYNPFNNELEQIVYSDSLDIINFVRDDNNAYYYSIKHHLNTFLDNTYSFKDKTTTSFRLAVYAKTFSNNGMFYDFIESKKGHHPAFILPHVPQKKEEFSLSKNKKDIILELKDAIDQRVNSITHLDDDNIWVSTKKGCINPYLKKHLFPKYNITRVLRDQENNYWIATYNSGIFFIPNLEMNHIPSIKSGVYQISKINEDEILLGCIDGYVYVYSIPEKKIKDSLFISENNTKKLIYLDSHQLLVHEPYTYIINLNTKSAENPLKRNGTLNIKNFQLFDKYLLVHLRNNRVQLFHTDAYLGNNTIPSIEVSDKWKLSNGCNDDSGTSNYCFLSLIDDSKNIENIHYEAAEKRIWIAFTKNTAIEKNQTFDYFNQSDQSDLKLNCFANHMDNGLIAGERKHGLIFIEGNQIVSRTEHHIYKEFGPIRKIITTDSLIISLAKKGIIVSDKKGNPLHTLDQSDGLKGSIINDVKFHSNQLWIGTNKGFHKIHINHLHDNLISPKVYINQILVNQEEIDMSLINNPSFSNNSDIEINYEAICFKGKEIFHYEYKLNNDQNWKILSAASNSIRFPNLSSGKYQFKIKAINEEGLEGKITIIDFRILPPFWLRWWFILGFIILISAILFFYNKRNLERIEKENQLDKERIERENQLQQEIRSNKLSALQSRMNPHFIFNSLNSIQDFIIKLDKVGANEYLGIFSDLMRVYLKHSEQDHIEIQEEVESLQLYLKLEELRFGDISVEFNIDHQLRNMDIPIPPLFIQPYIENAFKHGLLHKEKNKKLIISFKLKDHQLVILIEDNGVGRIKVKEIQDKTKIKGLSYSTKANQSRLELLNHNRTSKIKVNTIDLYKGSEPSGTLVKITIPLHII